MTKQELKGKVGRLKEETGQALQTLYDALNPGQQKQMVRQEPVRELFDRYGIVYTNEEICRERSAGDSVLESE